MPVKWEWTNRCGRLMMRYCFAVGKKYGILIHTSTFMDLESILQSGRSWVPKATHCSHLCGLSRIHKLIEYTNSQNRKGKQIGGCQGLGKEDIKSSCWMCPGFSWTAMWDQRQVPRLSWTGDGEIGEHGMPLWAHCGVLVKCVNYYKVLMAMCGR